MRSTTEIRRTASSSGWPFLALVLLLLALRLPHLSGPLDDPHSWRQCDTVTGSREFARHGIDLMHPTVAWLGAHRHMIYEFPLPEAIAAVIHRAFGFDPMWDRLVALAFFLLGLVWLHRLTREFTDEATARFTTFAYLLLPLSQFYSRAATIDFCAQAFAMGFLYHGVLAMRGRSRWHVVLAGIFGVAGSWLKVPYLVPVMFPFLLAVFTAKHDDARVRAVVILLATGLGFAWWRAQMNALNAAAPDWVWLPGYYKEVDPWWSFARQFPRLVQLPDLVRLSHRLVTQVFTAPGVALALFAFGWRVAGDGARSTWMASARRGGPTAILYGWMWLAGFGVFSLLFLPVEIGLEYMLIPVLAPAALLIALGGSAALRWGRERRMLPAVTVALLAFPLVAIATPLRLHWYRVDTLRVQAGAAVERHVPAGELVVVVDHSSDYSDPRVLHRADRLGFSVKAEHLTPALLARLQGVGVRWVAWISEPGVLRLVPPAFLAPAEVAAEPLLEHGQELGTVHIYSLSGTPLASDSSATAPGGSPAP